MSFAESITKNKELFKSKQPFLSWSTQDVMKQIKLKYIQISFVLNNYTEVPP